MQCMEVIKVTYEQEEILSEMYDDSDNNNYLINLINEEAQNESKQ